MNPVYATTVTSNLKVENNIRCNTRFQLCLFPCTFTPIYYTDISYHPLPSPGKGYNLKKNLRCRVKDLTAYKPMITRI